MGACGASVGGSFFTISLNTADKHAVLNSFSSGKLRLRRVGHFPGRLVRMEKRCC